MDAARQYPPPLLEQKQQQTIRPTTEEREGKIKLQTEGLIHVSPQTYAPPSLKHDHDRKIKRPPREMPEEMKNLGRGEGPYVARVYYLVLQHGPDYFRRDAVRIFAGEHLEGLHHTLSRRALVTPPAASKVLRRVVVHLVRDPLRQAVPRVSLLPAEHVLLRGQRKRPL